MKTTMFFLLRSAQAAREDTCDQDETEKRVTKQESNTIVIACANVIDPALSLDGGVSRVGWLNHRTTTNSLPSSPAGSCWRKRRGSASAVRLVHHTTSGGSAPYVA
eukprot:5918095-Amphidinium_carterae.2